MNTPNSDVDVTIKWAYGSSAGTGSTAGAAVKTRINTGASASTIGWKFGTLAYSLGTIVNVYDEVNFNGRAVYEWIPRGNEEFLDPGVTTAGIFFVCLKASSASVICNVSCQWQE